MKILLKRNLKYVAILVGVVILVSALFWLLGQQGEAIIYGVPYTGIYNSDFRQSALAAAVFSILQYWWQYDNTLPLPPLLELQQKFPPDLYVSLDEVATFFRGLGYDARVMRIESPKKLLRYVSLQERTPLLFEQMIVPDYAGDYSPHRVLVGVSLSKKIIIVHDVYLGPAYQISFDEWRANYPRRWPENYKFNCFKTAT